jgi:hypothetical protein
VVARKNAVLALEVGLLYRSGDTKPAARAEFNLLDTSLTDILKQAGLSNSLDPNSVRIWGSEDKALMNDLGYMMHFRHKFGPRPDDTFLNSAMDAIKPHIVQSATTDFSGKAQFEPVGPGVYYLMGFAQAAGDDYVIWNYKVDLKSGQNRILLDQSSDARN